MQHAIPFRARATLPHSSLSASSSINSDDSRPPPNPNSIQTGGSAAKLVAENSVIVFGQRGCCMCHVVKRLLLGLGANAPVVEVGEGEEAAVIGELSGIPRGSGNDDANRGQGMQFPAVFVGGKLFGGLERLMATHISGELIPILKEAGALWL